MLTLLDHPLVAEHVGRLRDERTPSAQFRASVEELSLFLAYEASRQLPTISRTINTPLISTEIRELAQTPILAPILRAGLGLTVGFQRLFPHAATAHIGLYRHPQTLEAVPYYANLPDEPGQRPIFVLDPMLATGNSAHAALAALERTGAQNLLLVTLIAAPEGVERVRQRYPHVPIFTAALDSHLNEHGYIVPGLGDAGDRIFGTTHSTPSVLL